MNHEHSRDTSSHENLTTPGIMGQIIELFTGSVRRDALLAIRTSTTSHWSIKEREGEELSVELNHPICRAQFRFSTEDRSRPHRLEALILSSDRGSAPLISAEHRVAQGFLECAQQRLTELLTQQKGETLALLREIVAGAPLKEGCSCSYEKRYINEHDNQHSDHGWSKRAVFMTPHGSIEIARELRDYEIKGELRREMLDSRLRACSALNAARFASQNQPPRPMFSELSPFGISPSSFLEGYSNTILCLNEALLPPLPDGRIDSASATFHHPTLERMLTLLNGRKSDLIVDYDRPHIDRVLQVIKEHSAAT